MLTTPIVARFHRPLASSSAMETLKLARSRSFKLRTTCRRSLSDCAASMWSSRVRKAMGIQFSVLSSQNTEQLRTENRKLLSDHFRRDALGDKRFDHVPGFDVTVVRNRDAALHAVGDFLGIVFKAAQRVDLALEHDHVVAQQADFGIALDRAVDDAATGDRSNFR